jgi:ABC-2 type transport system permease protein
VNPLLGVVAYEYQMAARRWSVWMAYAVAGLPFAAATVLGAAGGAGDTAWQMAGSLALDLNFWMPVVAGIAMADRLPRDERLGVRELLRSTTLARPAYVVGKYAGVVLATLTPVLATLLLCTALLIARGADAKVLPAALVAFLAIVVPAYLFVGAFSLACPAVLPVRVY